MEPTYIADHVEIHHEPPAEMDFGGNITLIQETRPEWDNTWKVVFCDVNGNPDPFKPGFKTREEAEGYMKGWNAHRNTVVEHLLCSKFKSAQSCKG